MKTTMSDYMVEIIVFLFALSWMCFGFFTEKRKWNAGVCALTGEPWVLFDRSSQGCRGYRSGEYTIWVSYPFIDKAVKV